MKTIYISDMTLSMSAKELSFREKLNIAKRIEQSGIDSIELPAISNSKEDSVVYKTIASSLERSSISIPGGDSVESISAAYECIKGGINPCVQIILPISTVQMEYIYHIKASKMLDKIASLCKAASSICKNVEFIAQDASRAEAGFVEKCCMTAFENGACAVTLCDDNGDYFPSEFAELVKRAKACCNAKIYIKPSNKLNMAAANAVAAIKSGADGIKTTSIGADGLTLAAIADILRARGENLCVESNLNLPIIHNVMTDIEPKASSYEIAQSEDISNDRIYLDGTAVLSDIISAANTLGYKLSDEDYGKVYKEFQRVCVKKGAIGSRELEAIIASCAMQVPSTYHVVSYVINSGNIITATANITLEKNGEKISGVSTGDGPIDAAFHAIEQIIGHKYELDDFQIQSVTKGREAVGSSLIKLRSEGKLYSGNGVSTDIVGACIRGYINALNKILHEEN